MSIHPEIYLQQIRSTDIYISSIYLHACMAIYLSIYLSIYLYLYLPLFLTIYLFTYLFSYMHVQIIWTTVNVHATGTNETTGSGLWNMVVCGIRSGMIGKVWLGLYSRTCWYNCIHWLTGVTNSSSIACSNTELVYGTARAFSPEDIRCGIQGNNLCTFCTVYVIYDQRIICVHSLQSEWCSP